MKTLPGFNLIEALIVVCIIGVLLAILIPSFFGATGKAVHALGAPPCSGCSCAHQ